MSEPYNLAGILKSLLSTSLALAVLESNGFKVSKTAVGFASSVLVRGSSSFLKRRSLRLGWPRALLLLNPPRP